MGLHDNKRMETAAEFLKQTLAQYPFKVINILTDNGIEFSYNLLIKTKKPKDGRVHPFANICEDQKIEHRTTLVGHPWTNGMVEAMNKKIKASNPQALPLRQRRGAQGTSVRLCSELQLQP